MIMIISGLRRYHVMMRGRGWVSVKLRLGECHQWGVRQAHEPEDDGKRRADKKVRVPESSHGSNRKKEGVTRQ
jgi:hypothetical protein